MKLGFERLKTLAELTQRLTVILGKLIDRITTLEDTEVTLDIPDGSITTAKLADNAVTPIKVRPIEIVERALPSDLSSSSVDNADLRTTGLTIGESYEIDFQACITSSAASGVTITVNNGANVLLLIRFDAGGSNFAASYVGNSKKFVATATSVTVDLSLGGSTVAVGTGDRSGTILEIAKLPYNLDPVASFS